MRRLDEKLCPEWDEAAQQTTVITKSPVMGRSTHSVRTRTCCSDCVLTVTCGACQRAGAPRRCAPLTPSVCWLAQKALREQIKSSFRGKDKMAHVVSLEVPIQQTLSTLHTDKAVRCVCWTHDGELLASAGDKGIVYVCDVHNGEIKMNLREMKHKLHL